MSDSSAPRSPIDTDTKRSDATLMCLIGRGDVEALQELIDRHWKGLVSQVDSMLHSLDEAQDVAQEVFVRVWEHRTRWRPGGSARAYLYRIARNLVLLRRRHLEVRERTESEVRRRAGRVASPLEDLTHTELREAFEKALDSLPDRRREAFLLVRFRGMSLHEAARVMNVTRRTVANHVYMAVCDLEDELRPFLS